MPPSHERNREPLRLSPSVHVGRRLAVPALPSVPGADFRFAPISRPETTPHTPLGITTDETPVQACVLQFTLGGG